MERIATRIVDGGPAGLAQAAETLRDGQPVAVPTETVYGLAVDATSDQAVARVFAAKDRPRFNPLIVHVADPAEAAAHALLDDRAEHLVDTLWPGPLTLVLRRRPRSAISLLATAGLDSVAVRMPSHPVTRRLLAMVGRPLAAPSANRSGEVSPTTAQHVLESLGGRIPLIVAGGRATVGVESSVVDLTGDRPVLLRPGGLPRADLEALLGPLAEPEPSAEAPRSPGRLASHYAPKAPVRLGAVEVGSDEALLTFGPDLRRGERVRNLSETGDLAEAAANLFAFLRDLDRPGVAAIAVAPIPDRGLGEAINDRLRRAAAPR